MLLVPGRKPSALQLLFPMWLPSTPPAPVASVPGPKIAPVDKTRVLARRAHVMVAMKGRAGQVRKRRVADLFEAFMRASSGGSRGWSEATPDDWLCYLDTHGGGYEVGARSIVPRQPWG